MSLSQYSHVVFSEVLAAQPFERRNAAIKSLEKIFEESAALKSNAQAYTPFSLFTDGTIKPYYGTEVFASIFGQEEREKIEKIGFSVRQYPNSDATGRSFLRVCISPELSIKSAEEKIEAIKNLKVYFESHLDIWTGADGSISIAEAAAQFLEGRVNLDMVYESEIITGDLTKDECKDVERLGFKVSPAGAIVFAM